MKDQLELVVIENHRLVREVRELRARVAAVESSRWWRLHPGRAARRLVRQAGAEPVTVQPHGRSDPADNGVADRFRAEVFTRGSFSQDWFTEHIPTWEPVMCTLERRRVQVLELGSFEGLSASFLLWRLPDAEIVCVDTFAGSPEHHIMDVDDSTLEPTFDRNVALVDASRVRKVVGRSAAVLLDLTEDGAEFDLVYVDASHFALDVLVDGALAWQLLRSGGFLIFDDYRWPERFGEDPLLRPGPAIDALIGLVGGHCEVVEKNRQAILRKRSRVADDSFNEGGSSAL